MSADDPVADFLEREKTELGDVLDESDLQQQIQDANEDLDAQFAGGQEMSNGDLLDSEDAKIPEETKPEPVPAKVEVPRVEPEKIKRWREEQKIRLETKDAEEEKEIEKWRAQAKKELDDWYKQRADQMEKSKKTARAAEKELIEARDTVLPGEEWERIAKLCEFNPKAAKSTKDVTRMRSLILQLKQSGGKSPSEE